jgi:hypothetical protein
LSSRVRKIRGGSIRVAQPVRFALFIEAFRVAQMKDFTNNRGPVFLK